MKAVTSTILLGALTLAACSDPAQQTAMLDCPMRDTPFSAESPLLDVLLNPDGRAILEAQYPNMHEQLPSFMLSTETPSFAAIMTPRTLADMLGENAATAEAVGRELTQLSVSDDDRRLRCQRYDAEMPNLTLPDAPVTLLVFHKINGYDHGPSVVAASNAVKTLAEQQGWAVAVTDRAGVFTPESLSRFDAVVWNNVSGDVLTLSQRTAFRNYIEQGGGFVGLHGSGGDSIWFWDWYIDELLRAQFIGHPDDPQFQDARVNLEVATDGIWSGLPSNWTMHDEWYSFADSPRPNVSVVASLDESTYIPELSGRDISMDGDHPIAWNHCVENGRSFYSAIGHREEVYQDNNYLRLLDAGLHWAAGQDSDTCSD